jgi:hypothetical protein
MHIKGNVMVKGGERFFKLSKLIEYTRKINCFEIFGATRMHIKKNVRIKGDRK